MKNQGTKWTGEITARNFCLDIPVNGASVGISLPHPGRTMHSEEKADLVFHVAPIERTLQMSADQVFAFRQNERNGLDQLTVSPKAPESAVLETGGKQYKIMAEISVDLTAIMLTATADGEHAPYLAVAGAVFGPAVEKTPAFLKKLFLKKDK